MELITEEQYKAAKEIVQKYEMEQTEKHRFCKGCLSEVHKTMWCDCGGFALKKSDTYSAEEMMNLDTYR